MKVNIQHVEKSKGAIFKKKLHGVALTVTFSEEEAAIINERKLHHDIILERGYPADVDPEKHARRGLVKLAATAAISGRDANHFHLTLGKLMSGTDTYYFDTPLEAKQYEQLLKDETLPDAKAYIMGNQTTGTSGDSFEL